MASTSSNLFYDTEHGNIETLSIYKCIFCNKLLDGKSKVLDCLHVICNDCMKKHLDESGLQCKCVTVTKASFIDYSLVSPSTSMVKKCDNSCNSVAIRVCTFCNSFYCKDCSKVHLSTKDHNPDLMLPYPSKTDFVLCTRCSKNYGEIYCTDCSVITCSLCHLKYDRMHGFKKLDTLVEETNSSLSEVLAELKQNTKVLNDYYGQFKESRRQTLEKQKIPIFHSINEIMQKLHDVVDERKRQLNQLCVDDIIYSASSINKNNQMLLDTQEKNKSSIEFVKTVLDDPKNCNFVRLLKLITDFEENPAMYFSGILSDGLLNIDFDETVLENCAAAIRDFGDITEISSMSVSNLSETNNIKTSDTETQSNTSQNCINLQSTVLNEHCNIQEEILNTANNISTINFSSDEESDYEEFDQCSCCNQCSYELIQCSSCNKKYHQNCHIPALLHNINDINPLQATWKCTLCQDVTILNQRDINGVFAVSETVRVIMERILMELYCQNYDSEHFRELPDRRVYRKYYELVLSPLSLNDVKNNMESNDSYTCLIKFLKDIKQVFSNGLNYYHPADPCSISAVNLTKYLSKMINDWIPGLDQKCIDIF